MKGKIVVAVVVAAILAVLGMVLWGSKGNGEEHPPVCSDVPREIAAPRDEEIHIGEYNFAQYFTTEISFGPVTAQETTSFPQASVSKGKEKAYRLSCAVSIDVQPRVECKVRDAGVTVRVWPGLPWKAEQSFAGPSTTVVHLNPDGYGKRDIYVFAIVPEPDIHPASSDWVANVVSADFTLIETRD